MHPCKKHYGHFLRDLCPLICTHFNFKFWSQDNDSILYVMMRGRRGSPFRPHVKDWLSYIFGKKIQIVSNRSHLPENTTFVETQEIQGNPFSHELMHEKKVVNDLRDVCLKNLNIKPQIKDKILIVPRRPFNSYGNPNKHLVGYEKLVDKIKLIAKDYEVVVWNYEDAGEILGHDSFSNQVRTWAESKIIVSLSGSDLCNAAWCHDIDQRIIEIKCIARRSVGRGRNSVRRFGETPEKELMNMPRDWHVTSALRAPKNSAKFIMTEEVEKEILKLIEEFIV